MFLVVLDFSSHVGTVRPGGAGKGANQNPQRQHPSAAVRHIFPFLSKETRFCQIYIVPPQLFTVAVDRPAV